MKHKRYGLYLFLAVAVFTFNMWEDNRVISMPKAYAMDKSPVVMELFTSQSCSSCPPADKVLESLAKNKNVIALGCHVTYWDHLSWKDTLSHEFCTTRQRAYATAYRSERSFTPELRINGVDSMVGSKKSAISTSLKNQIGALKSVDIAKGKNGEFLVSLPEISTKKSIVINLISYDKSHIQEIKSGENRGKTITYTNPVNRIKPIMPDWAGEKKSVTILISDLPKNSNGFAIIIQDNIIYGAGNILAAGQYKFMR